MLFIIWRQLGPRETTGNNMAYRRESLINGKWYLGWTDLVIGLLCSTDNFPFSPLIIYNRYYKKAIIYTLIHWPWKMHLRSVKSMHLSVNNTWQIKMALFIWLLVVWSLFCCFVSKISCIHLPSLHNNMGVDYSKYRHTDFFLILAQVIWA